MRDICVALMIRGEEMEDGAIVPDVDWSHLPVSGYVGFNPGDNRRSRSEPRARPSHRG
jgi:hypothetical protein